MSQTLKLLFLFLVINFTALGLGGFFTSDAVSGEWYTSLNKAPWTPPGWVFGAAWTTIMICFSIYLAKLFSIVENKKTLITLFVIQFILNVGWNPAFFHFHHITFGLVIISALTVLIGYMLFKYRKALGSFSILLLPYFVWLLIATSLNAFILINNP